MRLSLNGEMSCCCANFPVDVRLAVGASPSWPFSFIDPTNSNAAVNITGFTHVFIVKESPTDTDADAVFSLTSADGEIVATTAASGLGQVDHVSAKSELLEAGRWYYWWHRYTRPGGQMDVAASGKLYAETL
jgi:hypothetical protein